MRPSGRKKFHWSAAQILHAGGENALAQSELVRPRALVADVAARLDGWIP
jgi:hypothetical protein